MELNIDFPKLSDGASPDLKRIAAGLCRLTEQLKYVLSNLDEGNFSAKLAGSVGGVSGIKRDVSGLKEAIVKTAELVKKTEEKISSEMRNTYAAISDIGEYTMESIADYEVDGMGIDQYFNLVSTVAGEVDRLSGYIRCGVLDGDEIGIEIGDLSSPSSMFKVRLTGNRLSFFSGEEEVAYMSDSSLYVTKAIVSGKFTLGDYEIDPTNGLVFKYAGE